MAQAAVASWPRRRRSFANNGKVPQITAVERSRMALFLATAGLVAMGGGCATVPSGGGGTGPAEMGKPAVAPPAVPAPAKPAHKNHGGEGGEGGEG